MPSLSWKIGHVLPKEIEEKLSHSEEEYFKKHSTTLKSCMSKLMVDLTVVTSRHPFPISFPPPSLSSTMHMYTFTLCLINLWDELTWPTRDAKSTSGQ
ncbi:hypothetical protein Fmac_001680 [Flemingia macrophylla]|uniref:Uncharacterized protein n=1 Tax=Flemingia macrophylla TaxID=520843 RepID=A0ABD1NHU0_9FABA